LTEYKLTCNKLEVAKINCTTAGESLAGKSRMPSPEENQDEELMSSDARRGWGERSDAKRLGLGGLSVVRLAGIEPTTLGFGGQYSIH
jgi:hypothetical protein